MDDFNMTTITNAKNEYSITLINILAPFIIEGIKSMFKEALDLCIQNDEKNKYLMTFQNFLTRVPKWNQAIIDKKSTIIILIKIIIQSFIIGLIGRLLSFLIYLLFIILNDKNKIQHKREKT